MFARLLISVATLTAAVFVITWLLLFTPYFKVHRRVLFKIIAASTVTFVIVFLILLFCLN